MKTRNGFVSNSSTSSFFGIGIEVDEDFARLDELIEEIWNVGGLATFQYEDYGGLYFGVKFSQMRDDETLGAFKQRAAETIAPILAEVGLNIDNYPVNIIEVAEYQG